MATKKKPFKAPSADVRYWLDEISTSRRREKEFRKDGKAVFEIYSGQKSEQIPFNILYSNTETLLPALYSLTPRPVVQRRFRDEDPMGKAASMAGQRMLEFLADTNAEGYETFDDAMTHAVLDALLPGRGITCVKYDAEVYEDVVQWEQVCVESKGWDRVYFGFARKWSKVPWVAFEEYMDKEEAERLFGKEIVAKIEFTEGEEEEDDEKGSGTGGRDDATNDKGAIKTALVYQIWDKAGGKKIRYVSPHYPEGYLKEEDDPLGVTGFYPFPKPLQFLKKSNDLMPVAMYTLYENQAKELNRITLRLNRVIEALKVRGVYDGSLGSEIEDILKMDDNGLVPTDKASSLLAEGGLDKAIWLMPLDKLIGVAQALVQAREQCKRVIYEITGISDILRGQSMASETLGAQKIKESWGTLRLKRLQRDVQRYARDIFRIKLDIAASKFSDRTWAQMTGLPFATAEQKQQAKNIVMAAQLQGVPPDQQALAVLNQPEWGQVLEILRNDQLRGYKVDIETNSTLDTEATEDQKNISEVMNAIAQFLNGIGPMVVDGTMPFNVAQSMLLTIVRRFRFGVEVEDSIKAMVPPQPKGDPKQEAEMRKREQAVQQAEKSLQDQGNDMQQKAQSLENKLADEMAKIDKAKMELDYQRQVYELQKQLDEKLAELKAAAEAMELDKKQMAAVKNIDKMLFAMDKKRGEVQAAMKDHGDRIDPGGSLRPQVENLEASVQACMQAVVAAISLIGAPKKLVKGPDGSKAVVIVADGAAPTDLKAAIDSLLRPKAITINEQGEKVVGPVGEA